MVSPQYLLQHYGYWAVFIAIFLEDFGFPMPGETLLIAGSIVVARSRLGLPPLMFIAWGAAVLGDNIGYLIGRFGGRRLLQRYGRYILVGPDKLARAEVLFNKRGGWIVLVARFIEILRQLNGIMAGSAGMCWWRFLIFNAVGAAAWVSFWSVLFYVFGQRAHRIVVWFKRIELPVVVMGIAFVLLAIVFLIVRRNRAGKKAGNRQDGEA